VYTAHDSFTNAAPWRIILSERKETVQVSKCVEHVLSVEAFCVRLCQQHGSNLFRDVSETIVTFNGQNKRGEKPKRKRVFGVRILTVKANLLVAERV
jgi:hypothetical protein